MAIDLDDLRALALERAREDGSLDTLEKAASISKLVADERKTTSDLKNADRTFRLTRLQSLLSGATTLLSVLGLIATSLYNIGQLSTARSQVETSEWRDLLSSLEKPGQDILQDPTIPFRLRSFATSTRYARDARLIAATVMSKMTDQEGFTQLYNFIFPDNEKLDLNTMLEIARQQNFSFKRIDANCIEKQSSFNFSDNSYHNVCWNGYSEKQVQTFGLKFEDSEMWTLRRKYNALTYQLQFISLKIAEALKNKPDNPDASFSVTELHILQADLSNINFAYLDISSTFFDSVTLNAALLHPKKYNGVSFQGSNWWDARTVDAEFLKYLITYMYPRKGDYFSLVERPNKNRYLDAVDKLCHRSALNCDKMVMNFEES